MTKIRSRPFVDFLKYMPLQPRAGLAYVRHWWHSGYFPGALRKCNVAQARNHRFTRFLEQRIRVSSSQPDLACGNQQPSRTIRVLMTNHMLMSRSGTELWVYEMADYLVRNKLATVLVFSPKLGPLADSLRAKGVQVTSSPEDVNAYCPEVVHLQHAMDPGISQMLTQLKPGTPVLNFVHGVAPLLEEPYLAGRLNNVQFAGVSRLIAEKIRYLKLPDEPKIHLVKNFCAKGFNFGSMATPEIRSAALISPKVSLPDFQVLRGHFGCLGIALDRYGYDKSSMLENFETDLADYELVLGTGKTLIDCMGLGKCGMLVEAGLMGPAITAESMEPLSDFNYGLSSNLVPALEIDESVRFSSSLEEKIRQLQDMDSQLLLTKARNMHTIEVAASQLLAIYGAMVAPSTKV